MPNFRKYSLYMLHGAVSFNKEDKIKQLIDKLSNDLKSKLREGKSIELSMEEVVRDNSWWSSEND